MIGMPSIGSTARSRTALASPRGRVTTFIIQWLPYVKYTYSRPGGPNIVALKSVMRRFPWLAASPGS